MLQWCEWGLTQKGACPGYFGLSEKTILMLIGRIQEDIAAGFWQDSCVENLRMSE